MPNVAAKSFSRSLGNEKNCMPILSMSFFCPIISDENKNPAAEHAADCLINRLLFI